MLGVPIKILLPLLFLACAVHPAQAQSYSSTQANFHGYDCPENCSAHEAGYAWAADKNIAFADECSEGSKSFMEGCFAWVEERLQDETAQPPAIEAVELPENDYYE